MKFLTGIHQDKKIHLCEDNNIKLRDGDKVVLNFKVEQTGNWKLLKKIRALYEVAYDNGGSDIYYTKQAMINKIKYLGGYWDSIELDNGKEVVSLHSISYESMSDRERAQFLKDGITVCCEHICKHLNEELMKQAISRFLGFD